MKISKLSLALVALAMGLTQKTVADAVVDWNVIASQVIMTGLFIIEQPARVLPDGTTLSFPADRHKQGGNRSFLDGHVEHWRWKAPKVHRSGSPLATPGGDLEDHRKLQECLPHDVVRHVSGYPP